MNVASETYSDSLTSADGGTILVIVDGGPVTLSLDVSDDSVTTIGSFTTIGGNFPPLYPSNPIFFSEDSTDDGLLSEFEQENSDIVRGGINSSFTEFEAIIGVLADIGSSPQATVLFGEYLEGFAPETDLATANGLPIQEAAAVANLWINQGGFDEVSRSRRRTQPRSCSPWPPPAATRPTSRCRRRGARDPVEGTTTRSWQAHVWLGEFVDNHDECHREFDNSVRRHQRLRQRSARGRPPPAQGSHLVSAGAQGPPATAALRGIPELAGVVVRRT